MFMSNMLSGQIATRTGAKGPNFSITSACATSGHSLGEAAEIIRRGAADVMIAGGSEASVIKLAVAAFDAMRALSTRNDEPERASRPFDRDRDGFVIGEGAGVLVLEDLEYAQRRGARIYAELVGYGATADAGHITSPSENGEGAARAMRIALGQSGLEPREIGYLNAHATSTPAGDDAETAAIKTVFAEQAIPPVSSTKSMTGHLLGAGGAVEALACVKAITDGCLPPTINLENPAPGCDLDYIPNVARPAQIQAALSNSFGFGGQNSALIVRCFEA
jgi:3-oxoacyl-[acyl-carrier-protein] synthase II